MNQPERLNKYLALQLGISRREADELIEGGKVTVDGTTAVLGARIDANTTISVKGKPLAGDTTFQYIAFNKPVGYICSRKTQGENLTIYELLPQELHVLKPVGRLDKDSSGLLLLTNDGDFAFTMTHPKFYKVKIYEVSLNIPLEPLHQQMISDIGIDLPDGTSKLSLERLDDSRKRWKVTMSEGRNRQIRRTFSALGYDIITLHRTQFGPYQLENLAQGQFEVVQRSI